MSKHKPVIVQFEFLNIPYQINDTLCCIISMLLRLFLKIKILSIHFAVLFVISLLLRCLPVKIPIQWSRNVHFFESMVLFFSLLPTYNCSLFFFANQSVSKIVCFPFISAIYMYKKKCLYNTVSILLFHTNVLFFKSQYSIENNYHCA